jgi:phosphatidyl-myo-inositol dimannoside synthase
LVFSQHGLSYQLSPRAAGRLYSLDSFDAVWVLTRAAYRHDRYRVAAYEPLVTVLPNWINTEQFTPATAETKRALRERWGLPARQPVVLWLSRLVPKKGAHAVLESWPRIRQAIPDAFLWIVGGGGGTYESYLRAIIVNLGIGDSVRLHGAAAPDDVVRCHQAADLYVFPTLFSSEGFGLSLLEAMACGLPCIASDHMVLEELYSDDVLVTVPDANLAGAFVAPVVRLLNDAALRERMGRAARAFVVERFNHKTALAAVEAFYREQLMLAGATQ